MPIDIHKIRNDFPNLRVEVHGKPLVYLDNAATTLKPQKVIDKIAWYYSQGTSNVHRGVHYLSEQATAEYERSRDKIRKFINAAKSSEVIFTSGATASINLVMSSYGKSQLKKGDEILISEMEHHSNIVPWQLLREQTGVRLLVVPVLDDGTLDLEVYDRLLRTEPVRLVAVTHMSNVLGTINPLREMVSKAHAAGALALADAAQSVPHLPVDVQALDVDFLAFSGHKMLGPTGIGVLYAKRAWLEAMPPYQGGGDMIRRVRLSGSEWNELPYKFEAGTPAIAEGIGLGAAVDYLAAVGMEAVHAHEQQITAYALERLAEVPGLKVYGPEAARKGAVASFTLNRLHPHDVAQMLDVEGVAVRAGHHCAMPLHERFGIPATTRASFYLYNTLDEVDALIKALYKVMRVFSF